MIANTKIRDALSYAVIAGGVWLGWEAVKVPVLERGPAALAARLSPSSPEVLRRASEEELAAGRVDNAEILALSSLSSAPFNARALRVYGLTVARKGDLNSADEILTLAGNWSLRDDPAHAWLIERRLRQGSYSSAFAHADTLARRRDDNADGIFNLFTTAVIHDARALGPLIGLLAVDPPWRGEYISYLIKRQDAQQVLLALGVGLQSSEKPLRDEELRWIYYGWFGQNRLPAINYLKNRIGRPSRNRIQNADFSVEEPRQALPLGWWLGSGPGISTGFVDDDLSPENVALRVDYDGYATGVLTEQILFLEPGNYTLTGRNRFDLLPSGPARLRWTVTCFESDVAVGRLDVQGTPQAPWQPFRMAVSVPGANCTAQRLRLVAVPGDRRSQSSAWFDDFEVTPVSAPERAAVAAR